MRHRAKWLITQLTIYVFNGLSVLGCGPDCSFEGFHHQRHVVDCVGIQTVQKSEISVPEQKYIFPIFIKEDRKIMRKEETRSVVQTMYTST